VPPKAVVQRVKSGDLGGQAVGALPPNTLVLKMMIGKCSYLAVKMGAYVILLQAQQRNMFCTVLRNDCLSDTCLLELFDASWSRKHVFE
jgi:hypothetical protein